MFIARESEHSRFFVHLGQRFEVCSQNPTKIKNERCRARDPKLFHLLDHHGQLFEVCSQNPTIDGNESCRSRDSEHFWSMT